MFHPTNWSDLLNGIVIADQSRYIKVEFRSKLSIVQHKKHLEFLSKIDLKILAFIIFKGDARLNEF
jgi:hypothetical protein